MTTATDTQPMHALERANAVRQSAAQLRNELAAGAIDPDSAIFDERADSLPVLRFCTAKVKIGPTKAYRICQQAQVSPYRKVRDLTERQRRVIAEELA